jgi:hypothetical protein
MQCDIDTTCRNSSTRSYQSTLYFSFTWNTRTTFSEFRKPVGYFCIGHSKRNCSIPIISRKAQSSWSSFTFTSVLGTDFPISLQPISTGKVNNLKNWKRCIALIRSWNANSNPNFLIAPILHWRKNVVFTTKHNKNIRWWLKFYLFLTRLHF